MKKCHFIAYFAVMLLLGALLYGCSNKVLVDGLSTVLLAAAASPTPTVIFSLTTGESLQPNPYSGESVIIIG
jgi:hypothetical protein